jgi:Putative binding domain, N-terminal
LIERSAPIRLVCPESVYAYRVRQELGFAQMKTNLVGWMAGERITITSGNSGTGNGTVGYNVASNPGATRTGTITVAGQIFTVKQKGN